MEETNYIIDLAPILDVVLQGLVVLITTLIGWGITKLTKKYNLDIDEKYREHLYGSIEKAINYGTAVAKEKLKHKTEIDVRNAILAEATNYVLKGIPPTLKKLKLTEDRLRELVLAKLEEKNAG